MRPSPASHHPRLLLAVAAAVALLPHAGRSQQKPAAPVVPPAAASTVFVGEADYPSFKRTGADASKFDLDLVTLDAPGGAKKGFRFTTRAVSSTAYGEQALLTVPRGLEAGDVLSAHFYMRTVKSLVESGEGVTTLVVENGKDYSKALAFDANVANQWREFNLPFEVKTPFQPGEARVIFRVGTQVQTIEIAGLEIRNYHRAVPLSALPRTFPNLNYAGMEPDAPWRAEAAARIAKYRCAPLSVEVVDAAGNPVPNARVEVRQTRHAFGFGAAFSAEEMFDPKRPAELRASYQQAIAKNFNLVTIGNSWKWPRWEKEQRLPVVASQWCKEQGLELRGHNMIWPGWRHLPDSLKRLQDKPDEMRAAVLRHVEEVGKAAAPYVSTWDVINETYDNHDLMDLLGEHILVDIFNTAKKVDPHAVLYINDYNIVTNNGLDTGHQDAYEKVIQYLIDQHAPLEGIGLQGHFGKQFTPPARIYGILERFAKFRLPMQMTEFTLMGDDVDSDVRFMQDVMTVFFSHPSVNAFIFWGVYAGVDYDHKAEIFDIHGNLTPVGKAWRQLVYERWWTHESKVASAQGKTSVQGYLGNYEVTASRDGAPASTGKSTLELKPGGRSVKVVLKQ